MPRSRASVVEEKVTGSPSRMMSPDVCGDDAGQDLHQGRLAGAVLAEQRRHLAAVDVEVDALQRMDAAVDLGDVARGENDLARIGRRRRDVGHLTATLTGVMSQFFGLMRRNDADDVDGLAGQMRGVDRVEHRLLHRPVDAGAGVLVLDLVLELLELDVAGRIAQVGAVDRRPRLHADVDRRRARRRP